MPIRTQVRTVGAQPVAFKAAQLVSEQLLDDKIIPAQALLSEDWSLIGQRECAG